MEGGEGEIGPEVEGGRTRGRGGGRRGREGEGR